MNEKNDPSPKRAPVFILPKDYARVLKSSGLFIPVAEGIVVGVDTK
jgi:hypothetical protein